jgi:hypothetical protein
VNPTYSPTTDPTLSPTPSPTDSPTARAENSVIALCNGYYCDPWGARVNFRDQDAFWIWNDPNARSSVNIYDYLQFNKDFTSLTSYTGIIYANCDNYCYVYFNNQLVSFVNSWEFGTSVNVDVVTGSNTIIIVAWNVGESYNPAGIIASLYNPYNAVVVNTDSSWLWSRVSSSTSFTSTVPTPQPTSADVPTPQPTAGTPTTNALTPTELPTTLLYTNNPTIVHHNPKEKRKPKLKQKKNNSGFYESKHYQWWQGAKKYVGYHWQTHSPTKPKKDD